MNDMTKDEFNAYVRDHIVDRLPDQLKNAKIDLMQVNKSNGRTLDAISITAENMDIKGGPLVYLNDYYEDYQSGVPETVILHNISQNVVKALEQMSEIIGFSIDKFQDYPFMKERLSLRICDLEKNKSFLEDKPILKTEGDFAAYAVIEIGNAQQMTGSAAITESMISNWGITKKELLEDTIASDKKRCAPALYDVIEITDSILSGGQCKNLLDSDPSVVRKSHEPKMYVLTTERREQGASVIMDEEIRKKVGHFLKEDYYVLPSSIHEVMILPADFGNVRDLNAIVHEINENSVDIRDRLSDKVQFVDGKTGKMMNAEIHEQETKKHSLSYFPEEEPKKEPKKKTEKKKKGPSE